ncbi:MAG: cation:proton antiporter [Synergistetes bacterium]|nr:cation:proton antiporter [Synergistota bacterium]MCX8127720.1 cation:proton antiporter [Synergistota bacterium]MDW8191365.1 cation:proton antiporter [Synergistota bacterium]
MMDLSVWFMITGVFLVIFSFLAIGRSALGPTVPDRVVGLDTVNTYVVAAMIVFGAAFDSVIYVDIAIVYALLSFIATLFIARYLERGI